MLLVMEPNVLTEIYDHITTLIIFLTYPLFLAQLYINYYINFIFIALTVYDENYVTN